MVHQTIYASCSTLPTRLDQLKKSITSVLETTSQIQKLFIHYPFYCKRLQQDYPDVPEWMSQNTRIQVYRCEDFGSMTKFLPLLDLVSPDSEVGLLLFDDDKIFPENWLNDLISDYDGKHAVGRHGSMNLVKPFMFSTFNHSSRKQPFGSLSTGWATLYPRSGLPASSGDVLIFAEKYRDWSIFSNDDMLLASLCYQSQTPMYIIPTSETEIEKWILLNPIGSEDQVSLARTENCNKKHQKRLAYQMIKNNHFPVPWPELIVLIVMLAVVFVLVCCWFLFLRFD